MTQRHAFTLIELLVVIAIIGILNDNALCPDGPDWFGTFHGAKRGDWNGGSANAVFVDGHVERVKSALKDNPNDNTEKEFLKYEKFGWPLKKRPAGL